MRALGHLIVRLVAVLIGLCLAFLAAGFFLGFGYYAEIVAPAIEPGYSHGADGLIALIAGLFWSPFLAGAAFVPALGFVVIAELARLRGLTANIVLGGGAALVSFFLSFDTETIARVSQGTLIIVLAMGFIGGCVYWLIAGRNAGRWLESPAQ